MADVKNGGGEASPFRAASEPDTDGARGDDDAPGNASRAISAHEMTSASKASSKASSSRNSTPAAVSSDLRQTAQTANGSHSAAEGPQQSQQTPATAATASPAPSKEAKEPTAAPYGTRSRNRPGTTRPNYAEDVEMDFEMSQAPPNGIQSGPSSRGSCAVDGGHSSGMGGKKGSGAGQGHASWGNSAPTPKDHPANANASTSAAPTPAPAPAPAPSAAQPPKRRKNAATNGNHANAPVPSQTGTKRGSNAVVTASSARETNMMTFENTDAFLKNSRLEADDGRTISINDQVYLVCEPPGEPYYLCRVMEFIHANGDPKARVESLRVNWFYRPRDVQRYNNDTRLVYATMHSDLCPIASLRGKCQILHRSEINDLDEYRKSKDSFWFNQVFDRFIHRWYDVIPTSQVINVPDKVKKALDERWKYICLETSRVKELTSAVKTCKRCTSYCASNDSVECAVCRNTYHMNCVRPPLLKKPSRGFAWACGPCSRAQEKKLEARRTPQLGTGNEEGDEEELLDEEEEEAGGDTTAPTPNDSDHQIDLHPGTQAEIALAKMWPMRYLGIHCRVEDALQYDDRAIYPRASSRLGPRHQANVNVWHGHPVEFVKPAEIKKRYVKAAGHKKDTKLSKETVAAMEADKLEKAKRPKWVMDEPPGYVRRGEDHPNKDSKCTAELILRLPSVGEHSTRGEEDRPTVTEEQVEAYMERAKALAKHVGVESYQTDFLDKCLGLFTKHNYDADVALKHVKKIDKRKDLKIPELTKDEEKKWNEGVAKYGSEIRSVRLNVKTMNYGDAVRYYYMWKKTPKGREIWGSYSNRKARNKKAEADAQTRLLDDIADDYDDSAFDNEKAARRKRNFQCKFCNLRHSRQWRRAPGVAPGQTVPADGRSTKDKTSGYVVALCQRCANLWRKYAVKWENTDEIAKKVAQGGGKAWKRRIDEELLREVYAATSEGGGMNGVPEHNEIPVANAQPVAEPPKKKQKLSAPAAADSGTSTPVHEVASKKKEKPPPPPKAPTPPPVPAEPRLRVLPCAVCRQVGGGTLQCAACRLTVHKSCYGVEEIRNPTKWYCDTCKNDKKESVSYNYECVLCPHSITEQELYEPPKVSHKKKTDREREKERMERELVDRAKEDYRAKQQEKGRPIYPREPLKRTADNNWVHVYCALWHPETKFSSATRLDMVEGIGAPTLRYDTVCKLCKTTNGACVSCLHCHANFHVGCAHSAGYTFGFDITPVKATRRDAVSTVTINGETGSMMAAIWCKEHAPKTVVHPMNEEVEGSGLVALQLFARQFKQADLTLTGTARKANLVDQSTRTVPQTSAPAQTNRRTSTALNQTPTSAQGRPPNASLGIKEEEEAEPQVPKPERRCARCDVDVSPRWWKVEEPPAQVANGAAPNGTESGFRGEREQNPPPEKSRGVNGTDDHHMGDALPVAAPERSGRLKVDTDLAVVHSTSYLCHKCHWRKLNPAEEAEDERERSQSVHIEPHRLPLRSPPMQPFAPHVPQPPPPPPALAGPWVPHAPSNITNPPPALPPWHSAGPPPHHPHHNHPPPHVHNSIAHPPPPPPPSLSHPPPPPYHHAPYHHQPNGYPTYSAPPFHSQIPPPPHHRGPYVPQPTSGPPPPLHINGNAIMVNGVHSPRVPYSPTHPHGHNSSRSTESPFTAPPSHPQYPPIHRGSPVPSRRPSTPRDVIMRDIPAATGPPPERSGTGASASPSLANLIH